MFQGEQNRIDAASMEPRSFERGKTLLIASTLLATSGFNGAAFV